MFIVCEHVYYNNGEPSTVNIRCASTSSGVPLLLVLPCSAKDSGWLVIQQRLNSSLDFLQLRSVYRNTYGSPEGNFWYGLSRLRDILSDNVVRLKIYLESFDEKENVAVLYYDGFGVGKVTTGYKLKLGRYYGPASINDCLSVHESEVFRALDYRHISTYKIGWWNSERSSTCSNLNGIYRDDGVVPVVDHKETIYWNSFKENYKPLKRTQMSILLL